VTIIKTTTRILISTFGAAALFLSGATTASAHMSTGSTGTQSTAQVSSTTATTNRSTNTATTQTAYHHQTNATTTTANTAAQSTTVAGGNGVATALAIANSGTPYVYGGNTTAGFDCSGLVQYALGLSARTTYQQTQLGTHHYDVANAPAGAILFWGSETAPYHDAISLGNGSYVAAQNENDGIGVFSQTYWAPSYYIVL